MEPSPASLAWTKDLIDLESDVEEKSAAYAEARAYYEACAYPPAKYQFHDYNGHVYEFSDKDAYNQFLMNRGCSTI